MNHIGPAELRMVLLGKTGVGKSATGNTILGRDVFYSDLGFSSITNQCQLATAVIGEQTISVVDTPDFFYSTHTEDLDSEIRRSITLCGPGPHVFVYILKLETFTEQEEDVVKVIQKRFGEAADKYTTIVFTHADKLDGADLEEFAEDNTLLLDPNGDRYPIFNNKERSNRQQVTELLEKISRMVTENEGSYYTLEMLDEAERKAEEEIKMLQEEIHREEERKREEEKRELKREIEERVRKGQRQTAEKEEKMREENLEQMKPKKKILSLPKEMGNTNIARIDTENKETTKLVLSRALDRNNEVPQVCRSSNACVLVFVFAVIMNVSLLIVHVYYTYFHGD